MSIHACIYVARAWATASISRGTACARKAWSPASQPSDRGAFDWVVRRPKRASPPFSHVSHRPMNELDRLCMRHFPHPSSPEWAIGRFDPQHFRETLNKRFSNEPPPASGSFSLIDPTRQFEYPLGSVLEDSIVGLCACMHNLSWRSSANGSLPFLPFLRFRIVALCGFTSSLRSGFSMQTLLPHSQQVQDLGSLRAVQH